MGMVAAFAACTRPEPLLNNGFKTEDADTRKKRDASSEELEELPESDPILPDGGKPPGVIYAHTAKSLYLFDPLARTLEKKGDFDCVPSDGSMIDLAVNENNEVWGTTFTSFVKINTDDATCTIIKDNSKFPNSLGFVPRGTIDDNVEALVGYMPDITSGSASVNYVRVDLSTGVVSVIGEINRASADPKFKSSGDIIAMSRNGNRAFVTVNRLNPEGGPGNDFLAEVNPRTGQIENVFEEMTFNRLYGFGQWAGTGYAFSDNGDIVQINLDTGEASLFRNVTEDGGAVAWYGAGVSTKSPTKP